jgi:hypothetical protein
VVDGVEVLEQRFGAITKDGRMVTGDTRANLHERLRISEEAMRVTSLSKKKHVLVNLLIDPRLLWRVLCDGSEDTDLDNQHGGYTETHLMHLMTTLVQFVTPETTRDFATMKGWTKGDHIIFSLRHMRRSEEIVHPWGEQATVAGKESLMTAFRRLERAMRALWDNSFLGVFAAFEELCDGAYRHITDGYVRDMFEKVLHW